MNCFGRKPASYANDSNDHKPVGLFDCSECGATVTDVNKNKHNDWHAGLAKQVANKEEPMRAYVNNIYPTAPYAPTVTWSGGSGISNIANYLKEINSENPIV